MRHSRWIRLARTPVMVMMLAGIIVFGQSLAADDDAITVTAGQAVLVAVEEVKTLRMEDPTVADVIALSVKELNIIGRKAGVTTLTVGHGDRQPSERLPINVTGDDDDQNGLQNPNGRRNVLRPNRTMHLVAQEAVVFSARDVQKLALADPAVADVIPMSDREIVITGKKPGITTLTVAHTGATPTELFRVQVAKPGAETPVDKDEKQPLVRRPQRVLRMNVSEEFRLEVACRTSKLVVADAELVTAKAMADRTVQIQGKKPGTTALVIVCSDEIPAEILRVIVDVPIM